MTFEGRLQAEDVGPSRALAAERLERIVVDDVGVVVDVEGIYRDLWPTASVFYGR